MKSQRIWFIFAGILIVALLIAVGIFIRYEKYMVKYKEERRLLKTQYVGSIHPYNHGRNDLYQIEIKPGKICFMLTGFNERSFWCEPDK